MKLIKSYFKNKVYRIVEAQSYIATRQLVDSDLEQEILEELIDNNKPPYPTLAKADSFHYLLKTPFRYPPLNHGSRFGSAQESGIFYASLDQHTMLSEAAYYRFRFLLDSDAVLRPSVVQYTAFSVLVENKANLNLSDKIWKKLKSKISDPASYEYSQTIGKKARDDNFDSILYYSARNKDGLNLAVLNPDIFKENKIQDLNNIDAYIDYKNITFTKNGQTEKFIFSLEQFLLKGIFPII